VASGTQEGDQAKGRPSPYNELYELALMLGADEHPFLMLDIGPHVASVPAHRAPEDPSSFMRIP
jgi:hypothetical protein